jgi:restriction system protein
MAIPDYQSFMVPLLEFASDGSEHAIRDAYEAMAHHFDLTDDDRRELLPSGRQETYKNRVGWARTYLVKAGLLENTRRGYFRITDRGQIEFRDHASDLSTAYLKKFDEFVEFQTPSLDTQIDSMSGQTATGGHSETGAGITAETDATPEELVERAISELNTQLAGELLDALGASSPSFFERVVVDLLVAMGYGGSRKEAGEIVGRSGDAGIDGIIKEDRLGLDAIYVQAKRWEGSVGRPEIQKFVGALQGQRAHKGVFITTSHFTPDATDYARQVQTRVILIDGQELARLMIEFGIGTSVAATYHVSRLDSDFFLEA